MACSWLTYAADGLPTVVVTRQLQVERGTGKVRRPETDVLPLCHATLVGVVTAAAEAGADGCGRSIALKLQRGERTMSAEHYESSTVYFSDVTASGMARRHLCRLSEDEVSYL